MFENLSVFFCFIWKLRLKVPLGKTSLKQYNHKYTLHFSPGPSLPPGVSHSTLPSKTTLHTTPGVTPPHVSHCPRGQFQCASSECISGILQCDGVQDCPDGSDEPASCSTLLFLFLTYYSCWSFGLNKHTCTLIKKQLRHHSKFQMIHFFKFVVLVRPIP